MQASSSLTTKKDQPGDQTDMQSRNSQQVSQSGIPHIGENGFRNGPSFAGQQGGGDRSGFGAAPRQDAFREIVAQTIDRTESEDAASRSTRITGPSAKPTAPIRSK